MIEGGEPDRWQWVLGAPATEIWMDNWAIAAGAPNPEAAHAFIDYVLTPENSLAELDYIGYHTGATGHRAGGGRRRGSRCSTSSSSPPSSSRRCTRATVTEAQERIVEIWNAMKAAAGA